MESNLVLLSLIIFLPSLAALLVAFIPRDQEDVIKLLTFSATLAVFVLTLVLILPGGFEAGQAAMQDTASRDWIPSFNIYYLLGIDGISLPLVLLTSFLFMLSMGASWNITKHIKAYCILYLVLETGVLGVFLALDFILFYIFWEVMLLPMYFLIGVWGGPRREYAAIKFFLYTFLGGVMMLIALLMLYFNSDLVSLAKSLGAEPASLVANETWQSLHLSPTTTEAVAKAMLDDAKHPIHTFNILALAQQGQMADSPFDRELWFGQSLQWWAFLLLFIGFAIKVPAVPVHTWLPDAHVEAPTPISMILAGILLKLGGYGIIRICYPICPDGGYQLMYFVVGIGVLSMVYGAFAAMAQRDFKRLVAYSSVSHMGYVVVGLGVWSATLANGFNSDYWAMGMNGAMFQMIAHGISSAGMFFMVGVIYDRVHHRDLNEFGGLFAKMPVYSGLAFVLFFAALGLPGLCGFWGEMFVTLSIWNFSRILAVISAAVVILTAGYILWTLQRVYLGPEYRGPHPEALVESSLRERLIAVPLVAFAILLGVYPESVFRYMSPSVTHTATELADWTREVKQPQLETAQSEPKPTEVAIVAAER